MKERFMEFRKEISEKLNNLLKNNLNSAEIYQKAFDKSESNDLKVFLRFRAKQRKRFADELRIEVLRYGQIPEDDASFKTSLTKNWLDMKTLFSGHDERIVMEACLESDRKALKDYEELITEKNLPPTLDALFTKHHQEIQNAINKDKLFLQEAVA